MSRPETRPDDAPDLRHLGTRTFAADPDQVRTARHWLMTTLATAGSGSDTGTGTGVGDGTCDDCVLLLSEAMTNSVRHSTGDKIEVSVHAADGTVRIEVIDGGGVTLPHRTDQPCGENGRGLPIMLALARTWAYETLPDGRLRVWFTVAVAAPRRSDGGKA